MDNRLTDNIVKLKIHQLHFFTNLSNLNTINNTHYAVKKVAQNPAVLAS